MTDGSSPNELLQGVRNAIKTSLDALDSGKTVDVKAIENAAKSACETILALPAEQAKPYQSELEAMITELSEVTEKLSTQNLALEHKAGEADYRHQAQMAYMHASKLKKNSPNNSES